MHLIRPLDHGRRAFMRRTAQLAFTGAALPTAINLSAFADAAAFTANDYKALVCVFLYGGNDSWNTVVPYDDTNYGKYSAIRGGIAINKSELKFLNAAATPTASVTGASPTAYGLHPKLTGLADLFNAGVAAVQLNVGPLVVPLTRVNYEGINRVGYPLPPKLFSHNDQQSIWQASKPEGTTQGWGGSIGDLILQNNSNGSNATFTCVSLTDAAVFLAGQNALTYQVGTGGATKITSISGNVFGSAAVKTAMDTLIRQTRVDSLERAYNATVARSISAEGVINGVINGGVSDTSAAAAGNTGEFLPFAGIASTNRLAAQLKMVARLIKAQSSLAVKRQVFFVSLGGFDMHDGLIDGHNRLLDQVDKAVTAFYKTTENMLVKDKVTTFTASDFGRTLTSNGDGSDHGWGGHHFIVGGAINGQRYYGKAPPVSNSGVAGGAASDQWHVGGGRLLPSTSVDQYAATLAKWFGVADTELNTILPNLKNFGSGGYPKDLGFMKPG